jgi:DNA/RNA-binding domain of Phe-tRNA-synthetase-like protein
VETLLLSAGHDAAKLVEPVVMDVSREGESMTQMNGTPKVIRTGDMIMRDAEGLACSILYGQDNRSPISQETSHVLYVTYSPPGVPAESVEGHLRRIEANIRLFAKSAVLEQFRLITAY